MKLATVPPQVFHTPPHDKGESFWTTVLFDGTRAGFIAAANAYLAQAPQHITSLDFEFEGERIFLSAEAARNSALQ